VSGPYRGLSAREILEAPTRDGPARLEIRPDAVVLDLGSRWHLTVAGAFLAIERPGKRRRRSRKLTGRRLVAARGYPTGGVALWYEERPGMMRRVEGLRPVTLLDADGLSGVRALDRLASRLMVALRERSGGLVAAIELGNGKHRVLLLDDGRCYRLYARPLFREHPRLALEVCADGSVVTYRGGRPFRRARCRSRYDVILGGDFIRFVDRRGVDRAAVALPWIGASERAEIAARVGERVHRADVPAR
jgi:hypothetical protein